MRVFITGATGWVGSAVVRELQGAAHELLALCRSEQAHTTLTSAGVEAVRGDIQNLDVLRASAARSDAVVHLAFDHDFSKFAQSGSDEHCAIGAIAEGLAGRSQRLVVTSGIALLAPGTVVDETTPPPSENAPVPRNPEAAIVGLVERGVRAAAVRLPPSVHGHGDHGFVAQIVKLARERGVSPYVGAGDNRWPAVHRFDAARLFRLVLENTDANGPFHAVGDAGVAFKHIAEVIGRRLDLPTVSIEPEQAEEHFGWLARFAGADMPASSDLTRAVLGWVPEHPSLIEDLDHDAYFTS